MLRKYSCAFPSTDRSRLRKKEHGGKYAHQAGHAMKEDELMFRYVKQEGNDLIDLQAAISNGYGTILSHLVFMPD